MNLHPAEALSQLNNKVVDAALSGKKANEMQFHRLLREAQGIAPGTILNDIALVMVNGAWNRFDDADKAIQRAERWSSIAPENAYELAAACVYAWRPATALQYMRYAADRCPGNTQYIQSYYKFSMLTCATESMRDARLRAERLGMNISGFTDSHFSCLRNQLQKMSISEESVINFVQTSANIVRGHFENDPHHLLVTHPRLVMDPDTGVDEIWFDFVLHTSPEKGAQIEWDLAFAEMPTVDEHVRDHVNVAVRLVDEFADLNIQPELVS